MLRLAALGVLLSGPLNGYRLMQQLEIFMSCCISVNSGAIYPLLRRMEDQGEVTLLLDDISETGQAGKTYGITALGRNHWRQQMLAHPHESWVNSRSRFAIKFFFFSHLEPTERLKLIEHRLMHCRLRLAHRQAQPKQPNPYQAAVWQRSLNVIESEIQWLTQQLARESLMADPLPTDSLSQTVVTPHGVTPSGATLSVATLSVATLSADAEVHHPLLDVDTPSFPIQ